MITNDGAQHIKRVLAGWEPAVAQSIAFGVGDFAENAADSKLEFEVSRADVALSSYDYITNSLVFKAKVPDQMSGTVTEIGLYSGRTNGVGWQTGSRLISTFDSSTEEWTSGGVAATYDVLGSRTGTDSLMLTATANGSTTAILDSVFFDLSGGSVLDDFSLALYNQTTDTSSVSLRLKNDADNYFQFSLAPSLVGYQVVTVPRSDATVVGAPRWGEILTVEVVLNAKASGSATITLDALRVDSKSSSTAENILVAREVLATPFVKENDRSQEVEFRLAVNIA